MNDQAVQSKAGPRDARGAFRFPARKSRRPSHVTAIDLDGSTLRVAQTVRRGTKVRITRLAAEPLPPKGQLDMTDAHAVGVWVAQALSRMKIKSGTVVMGVPRALVLLKPMSLPDPSDAGELAAMVHFQAGKELPFKADEATLDFKIQQHFDAGAAGDAEVEGGEAPARQVEVLIAAVRSDVVRYYKDLATAARLKLMWLGLRSYANVRCVEVCKVYEGSEGVALVSLRPDEIIIDVLVEHSLAFSRVASVSIQDHASVDDAPESRAGSVVPGAAAGGTIEEDPQKRLINAMTMEVTRSLHSYEGMERHSPVAKVLVAGDTGVEQALVMALAARLKIPCGLLDPASELGLDGPGREHASAAIAAIGLAISAGESSGLPFDFLNPKRPPVRRDTRKLKLAAAVALIAAVIVTAVAIPMSLVADRKAKVQSLRDEIASLKKSAKNKDYDRIRRQHQRVSEWLKSDRDWLAHVAHLSAILPHCTDVYVNNITTVRANTIRLGVQARDSHILAELENRLRAAGYQVKSPARKPGADKFGYPFNATVELTIPANLAIDLSKLPATERPTDDASADPTAYRPAAARPLAQGSAKEGQP